MARRAICAPAFRGRWSRSTSPRDWRSSSKVLRIASGASFRTIRPSNGSCETAGSGSPVSTRTPEPCGSSDRQASSRTRPNMPLRWSTGESAAWYQGKRGFLPPVTIVQGPSAAARRARDAGWAVGMMPNVPSRVDGARRCRIAGGPARAAWRRVARQPAAAGAMDGTARWQAR